MEDIYRSEAGHLDNLPRGYLPTDDGIELPMLARSTTDNFLTLNQLRKERKP